VRTSAVSSRARFSFPFAGRARARARTPDSNRSITLAGHIWVATFSLITCGSDGGCCILPLGRCDSPSRALSLPLVPPSPSRPFCRFLKGDAKRFEVAWTRVRRRNLRENRSSKLEGALRAAAMRRKLISRLINYRSAGRRARGGRERREASSSRRPAPASLNVPRPSTYTVPG